MPLRAAFLSVSVLLLACGDGSAGDGTDTDTDTGTDTDEIVDPSEGETSYDPVRLPQGSPLADDASSTRIPSDMEGIDLIIRCHRPTPPSGYSAETDSGVPLSSPYARQRGADRGLITMMSDQRRTRAFWIARERVRSAVEVRYDTDDLDRLDLLLMDDLGLVVVHTHTTNAGIFTVSDVWQFPDTSQLPSLPEPLREFVQRGLQACT